MSDLGRKQPLRFDCVSADIQPRIIVALGAMAAQTLFGTAFGITRERGRWIRLGPNTEGVATWHPSAMLRAAHEQRAVLYRQLVEDLGKVAAASPLQV